MNIWRRLIASAAVLVMPAAGTVLLAAPAHAAGVSILATWSNSDSRSSFRVLTAETFWLSQNFTTTPTNVTKTVQWFRLTGTTATPISGATTNTLSVDIPASWYGDKIFQRVTLSTPGYTSATADSPKMPVVKGQAYWGWPVAETDATGAYTGYHFAADDITRCATVKANGTAISPGVSYPSNELVEFTGQLTNPAVCEWLEPDGASQTWELDLRLEVVPVAPTRDTTAMTITIPSVAGLKYRLNGTVVPAGTHLARGYNTVVVEAADSTHVVASGSPTTWTLNNPIAAVTPTAPSSNAATGVITFPNDARVQYRIAGQTVTGSLQTWKNVTVTAVAADVRYDLTGTTSWSFDHRRVVTPAAPSLDQATLTYTVPSTPGVVYTTAGTPVAAGTNSGTGWVTLSAEPADDTYRLAPGATTTWNLALVAAPVVAPAPSLNPAGTAYVIPAQAGVRYRVDGTVTPAGTYPATTVVSITAEAVGVGYLLAGPTTWSLDLRAPVVPAAPTWNVDTFTHVVPSTANVEYLVNGVVTAAGTYQAPAGSYTVTARATGANHRLADGATASWSFTFATENVTPTPPTADQSANTLTIPTSTKLRYLVDGTVVPAGTHTYHREVTVTVQPTAAKYLITGTRTWTLDLRDPVTPAAPTWDDEAFTYTIPTTAHVEYLVNGTLTPAGTHDVESGTVTITARPSDATHRLAQGATATWTFTFATENVTPTPPTADQSANTLTIPTSTKLRYLIDGTVVPAGTHTYHREVTVTVQPTAAKYLITGTRTWTLDLRDPVTPAAPTWDQEAFTYTVPSTPGVEYVVSGQVRSAGTHDAAEGTVVLSARPADQTHRIADGAAATWTATFVTEAVSAVEPSVDRTSHTVTIPALTGIRYLQDGTPVDAGTHTVRRQVEFRAVATAPKYRVTGTDRWTVDLRDSVVPSAPTWNTTAWTVTIPATAGVTYRIDGTVKGAGTYPATPSTSVTATASDDSSVLAEGATAQWHSTLKASDVRPKAPTGDRATGRLTIPSTTGVTYLVDGVVAAPGVRTLKRTVAVTARATSPRYRLVGTTSWRFNLAPVSVRAVKPKLVKATGRLKLTPGVGVVWKVNGKTVPTTRTIVVKKGKKVTVQAVAAPGHTLTGTTRWVLKRPKR